MTGNDRNGGASATAFDALVDKMKADISKERPAQDPADHVSLLQSIFHAALADAGAARDALAGQINEGKESIRAEIRSHPAATISAAFAAGYVVGKSIVGKIRK